MPKDAPSRASVQGRKVSPQAHSSPRKRGPPLGGNHAARLAVRPPFLNHAHAKSPANTRPRAHRKKGLVNPNPNPKTQPAPRRKLESMKSRTLDQLRQQAIADRLAEAKNALKGTPGAPRTTRRQPDRPKHPPKTS